jgi:glycosyltransferase involved in cell wall biosynthesis
MKTIRPEHVLLISQVYVPDPAAVGQHMADVAEELVRRGHTVSVLTSAQGYDDPTRRFPSREVLHGVNVRRLGFSSFGKASFSRRMLGSVLFLAQAAIRALFSGRVDVILVSTSPPMAAAVAAVIGRLKGARVIYWLMDLNPDQLIAAKLITADSLAAKSLRAINNFSVRGSDTVVVLDDVMAARVMRSVTPRRPIIVLPPWSHDEVVTNVAAKDNPFRSTHGIGENRIVMYSGNHALSSPVATLLRAIENTGADDRLRFFFIGGGLRFAEVKAVSDTRVKTLPYQPLEQVRFQLSAADVHVITLDDEYVGVVHPCKFYSALSLGKPILYLGRADSPFGRLVTQERLGWQVDHGDIAGAEQALGSIAGVSTDEMAELGRRARTVYERIMLDHSPRDRVADVVSAPVHHIAPVAPPLAQRRTSVG